MLDVGRVTQLLEREGVKLISELQAAMVAQDANASGRTSDSLGYEIIPQDEGLIFQLYGGVGWAFVEQGRGRTRNDGDGSLRGIIRQWMDDRGIEPDEPDMSKDTLAFLITRAIHQRGTLLHLLNERRDIYTSVLTDERIELILEEIGDDVEKQVLSDVVSNFKPR
jgi:hypothetical protein